jgi:hypothetical protein
MMFYLDNGDAPIRNVVGVAKAHWRERNELWMIEGLFY